MNMKDYLGDSVYVEYDDNEAMEILILTTNNGYPDDPRNRIVLDTHVYNALLRFVERVKEANNKH